jgi:hypothetical protein
MIIIDYRSSILSKSSNKKHGNTLSQSILVPPASPSQGPSTMLNKTKRKDSGIEGWLLPRSVRYTAHISTQCMLSISIVSW